MFEPKNKEKPIVKPEETALPAEAEKMPLPEVYPEQEKPMGKVEIPEVKPAPRRAIFIRKKTDETQQILEPSETVQEIEAILSEGLEEAYQSLPDNLKDKFREEGRQTASKIEKIISAAKIVVNTIVELIRRWLMIIPGVNRFFLEQEIKIKTDKILALAEKKKKKKLEL